MKGYALILSVALLISLASTVELFDKMKCLLKMNAHWDEKCGNMASCSFQTCVAALQNKPVLCDVTKCGPGCACKPGFYLDSKGDCVPPSECV